MAQWSPWTSDWLAYLLAVSGRGAVLLAAAGAAAFVCSRQSAGLRHLLWTLGLAGLAGLTAFGWAFPSWHVGELPGQELWALSIGGEGSLAGGAAVAVSAGDALAADGAAGSAGQALLAAPAVLPSRLPAVILAVWAAGALLLLARHLRSLLAAHGLVAGALVARDPSLLALTAEVAARLGLADPVAVRLSPAVTSPFSVGVFRPVILLPSRAVDWPTELQRSVLAHELAHVKRGDCGLQVFIELVRAIHWMNPLVWLAAWRVSVERELACDDQVLAEGTRPSAYADHLLSVSRTVVPADRLLGAGGACMVGTSRLASRLLRLLDGRCSHAVLARRTALLTGVGFLLLALPVGCLSADPPAARSGVRLVYTTAPAAAGESAALIKRRLDQLGVESPRVQRRGARIEVELPLATEQQVVAVKHTLGRSGELRFVVVKRNGEFLDRLVRALGEHPRAGAAGIRAEVELVQSRTGGPAERSLVVEGSREELARMLADLSPELPPEPGHSFLLETLEPGATRARLLYVHDSQSVTLTRLADAQALRSEGWNGYEVRIQLSADDGQKMEALTSANIGQRLAIVAHGNEVWAAPVIQSVIRDRVVVTMRGEKSEAEALAANLRGGALPTPLQLLEEAPLR